MKRTQMQRQQYIAGMEKKTASPAEVAWYKAADVFEAERLMRERDMECQPEWIRSFINDSATEAYKAVWQRYRMAVNGGKAYETTSKKCNKRQISKKKYNSLSDKQKRNYSAIIRNASGVTIEPQRLYEMFLAARAAWIDGWRSPLTGNEIEPGIKAASAACAYEFRRGLQMPLFDDVTEAEKWNDRAWAIHRDGMEQVAQNFDPERLPSLEKRDEKLAELRQRITNHWKSTGSKRWKMGAENQIRLLEKLVANAYEGTVCVPTRNSAEEKAQRRLMDVIHKPLIASDLQDLTEPAKPINKALPENRMRIWRSWKPGGNCGWVEYTNPTPQAIAKQEVVEIPTPKVKVLAHTEVPVFNILGQKIGAKRTSVKIA